LGNLVNELALLRGGLSFAGAEHDAEAAFGLFWQARRLPHNIWQAGSLPHGAEGADEGGHGGGEALVAELGGGSESGERGIGAGGVEGIDEAEDFGQSGSGQASRWIGLLQIAKTLLEVADFGEIGFVEDGGGGKGDVPDAGAAEAGFDELVGADDGAIGPEVAREIGFNVEAEDAERGNERDEGDECGDRFGAGADGIDGAHEPMADVAWVWAGRGRRGGRGRA
jgi:hypothetical protein